MKFNTRWMEIDRNSMETHATAMNFPDMACRISEIQ